MCLLQLQGNFQKRWALNSRIWRRCSTWEGSVGIKERNPCLLHEIWVRYGMAVASWELTGTWTKERSDWANICIPQSFWKQWLLTLEYENWQLQYWAVSADLLDYCDSTYASWLATTNSSLVMNWKSKQQAASFHWIDTHPPNRSPELQRLGSCFGTPINMEANQWCKATK